VNVLFTKEDIKKKIIQLAEGAVLDYNLSCKIDESSLEIIDGYSTEGYKNIAAKKIKLIKDFAGDTGILLDPAYTGKAFYAYNDLILKKRKGKKVIFLHTGGIFGSFAKRSKYLI
jgi:D-cysteine desulfhydrase